MAIKENSVEEDIINAQHFINSIKTDKDYKDENGWHGYYNREIVELVRILDHILSDYKRVLKENEELKFEERSRIIGKYGDAEIHDVINRTLSNDYIPVKKVKNKIEYLDKQQKQWLEDRELKASDSEIIFARDVLRELLEGRK